MKIKGITDLELRCWICSRLGASPEYMSANASVEQGRVITPAQVRRMVDKCQKYINQQAADTGNPNLADEVFDAIMKD